MEPGRTLYESEDEHEIRAIAAYLEEHGIAVATVFRTETAYPGLFGPGAKHSIRVAEADFERAEGLAADFLESEAQSLEGGPYRADPMDADPDMRIDDAARRALIGERIGRARVWLVKLVLAGSLAMNALVFVGALVGRPPPEGELEFFDANGTRQFVETYSGSEFPDEQRSYDRSGELTWTSVDRDRDGRFDRLVNHHGATLRTVWTGMEDLAGPTIATLIDAGETRLRAIDDDQDGVFDRWELGSGATARDADRDGFPDVVECAPGAPAPEVDLAACLGRVPAAP